CPNILRFCKRVIPHPEPGPEEAGALAGPRADPAPPKPPCATLPGQRTKFKRPLVATADRSNLKPLESFPCIEAFPSSQIFQDESLRSFFPDLGSSRTLHSDPSPKLCQLELCPRRTCPSQEIIVGRQPLSVASLGSEGDLRSLSGVHLQPPNKWNRALFDLDDTNLCVNGALFPCLLACYVAHTQGECCCLPYLPGALVAMRTSLRTSQGIQGSIAEDWLVMCCCPVCGLCQMARQQDNPST
uniref:Cornifelin n=2 Tax=Sarcophilus harrisii TaxID=9305 RepID=A0A7N4V7C2_SARHA